MLDQGYDIINDDPRGALKIAGRVLRAARAMEENRYIARALLLYGICQPRLARESTAVQYLRKAERIAGALDDPDLQASIYQNLGMIIHSQGKYPEAIVQHERALEICRMHGRKDSEAIVLNSMGSSYRVLGEYSRALELYEQGKRIFREAGHLHGMAAVMNSIAIVYSDLGEWERARAAYVESLELHREQGTRLGEATALGNIGITYTLNGQPAIGLEYQWMALKLYGLLGSRDGEGRTLSNIADAYAALERFDRAIEYYDQALEILGVVEQRSEYAEVLKCKGALLVRRGAFEQAIPQLRRVLAIVTELGLRPLERDANELIASALEATGSLSESLRYYKQFLRLKSELDNQATRRAIAEMEMRDELEKARQERDTFESRAAVLTSEVEYKSRQLASMALHISRHNEFLKHLRDNVLPFASKGERHLAEELKKEIDGSIHEEGGWKAFELQFEHVHSGFLRTLTERYPELTPTERRICTLLKLDQSSKDIAGLLNASVHTVETHRRRIRKKLVLGGETNLASFIAAL